jgi:DNA processing protein
VNIPGRAVVPGQPEYPHGLYDLPDRPAVLWVRGTLPSGCIAIVGSRYAGERALHFAFDLAAALGAPVVSGLAHGVDSAAHRGALAGGVPTLAYVGTGIDRTYPYDRRDLEAQIVGAGGGIASEQAAGAGATRWTLMRRDRLQAAHAFATVLIVTEATGGAMETLRFARRLSRPRYALSACAGEPCDGNALAIAEGAIPLPWNVERACELIVQSR